MDQTIEMTTRLAANQKEIGEAERNVSPESNERSRSRFQMVAIITALYVSQLNVFDVSIASSSTLLTYLPVILIRGSSGRNHCLNSGTDNISGSKFRGRLHMDWRCIPSSKCSIRTDIC